MFEASLIIKNKPIVTHNFLVGAMALLLASLTLSPYMMSVSQFIMVFFWFCDNLAYDYHDIRKTNRKMREKIFSFMVTCFKGMFRNLKSKIGQFTGNKPALLFSSIYFMHVLGMLWSSDISNGLRDLRVKLPILILPLIISTMPPLSKRQFHFLILIYISGLLVNTLISSWVLFRGNVVDPREISLFIYHIRFSLNVCLGIFILLYYLSAHEPLFNIPRLVILLILLWFIVFLVLLKSLSGIVIFIVIFFFVVIFKILIYNHLRTKLISLFVVLVFPVFLAGYTFSVVKNYVTPESLLADTLSSHTSAGNPYQHSFDLGIENGRYVGLYVCWDELEKTWNERSKITFNGPDNKGNQLRYTLIRYLHSKHLRKDASGVNALDEKDISNVENGVANIAYLKRLGIKGKIYEAIMGYENLTLRNNPNSNTFTQRIEHWRASLHVIKAHWLTGVGTGDVDQAVKNAYAEINSRLEERWQLESHNQFLTILVGFGLIGLIWFITGMVLPIIATRHQTSYLMMFFFAIVLFSMMFDDTIESQAGVTFFSLFYSLFLWGMQKPINKN